MAKVKWTPGIEYVSGLLGSRPKAGNPHSSHSSVLLATHRVAATENPDCTRIYMVGEYKRSTVPQAKELAARSRGRCAGLQPWDGSSKGPIHSRYRLPI